MKSKIGDNFNLVFQHNKTEQAKESSRYKNQYVSNFFKICDSINKHIESFMNVEQDSCRQQFFLKFPTFSPLTEVSNLVAADTETSNTAGCIGISAINPSKGLISGC